MLHLSLSDLMNHCRQLQKVVRGNVSDYEVAERLLRYRPGLEEDRDLAKVEFWCVRWGALAFPRVTLGSKRAASFMATGVSSKLMQQVIPPWRAFLIELLESDLRLKGLDGVSYPINRVAVSYSTLGVPGATTWTMLAGTPEKRLLVRSGIAPEDWLSDGPDEPLSLHDEAPISAEGLRACKLLSRLIAGVSIHMADPRVREEARRRARSSSYRRRRSGPPLAHDFVFGEDVRLDVRAAVREYAERGGTTPKVQSLIRGHWKWQVCGAGRAERKWIHVEPYWRGPEDAPILVRSHVAA